MTINSISNTITGKNGRVNDNQQANKLNNPLNQKSNAQSAIVATDTVNITGAASQLQTLEKQLSNLPVVDVQRVDAIKRQIANGTYEIDAPRIAEKMIQIESSINEKLV